MGDLIQVFYFAEHSRIERGLIEFAQCLRGRIVSRLKVMNRYGWCSPKATWEGQCHCAELKELKDFFLDQLPLPREQWELSAWFNILDPGGTIGNHNHRQSSFAMAYHIKGGSGLLIDSGDKSEMLPPIPGRMVVFPGTTFHAVPQPAIETRYSLSVNADLKKK